MNVKKESKTLKKSKILNHIYAGLAILLSLLIGKAISHFLGGLPGSLYGMMIFAILLSTGIFNANKIQATITLIFAHMGVLFVPAGVGTINYLEMLGNHWLTILLMIVISTLFIITIVGLLAQKFVVKKGASTDVV